MDHEDTSMLYLTPSPTRPGYWRLGEHELTSRDVIEVWIQGHWYLAQVEYNRWSGEQQLRIHGQRQSQPFTPHTPGRWPAGPANTHAPAR
jgi:hypothetical protein